MKIITRRKYCKVEMLFVNVKNIIYLLINSEKSSIIITLKIVEWNKYGYKG